MTWPLNKAYKTAFDFIMPTHSVTKNIPVLNTRQAGIVETPCAIYMAGLVFQWLKRNGGVAAMEKINIAKAKLIYDAIDASNGFYNCPVAKTDRSRMNVPFTLKNEALDGDFLKQAEALGMLQLKGHRSVGGMRASIYNAMPLAGVQVLVGFMTEFAQKNQGSKA